MVLFILCIQGISMKYNISTSSQMTMLKSFGEPIITNSWRLIINSLRLTDKVCHIKSTVVIKLTFSNCKDDYFVKHVNT